MIPVGVLLTIATLMTGCSSYMMGVDTSPDRVLIAGTTQSSDSQRSGTGVTPAISGAGQVVPGTSRRTVVTPEKRDSNTQGGVKAGSTPTPRKPMTLPSTPSPSRAVSSEPKSVSHHILWYIPNRVMDIIDIVRFRARVGPGLAMNIRLTERADVYLGRYHTAFIGLPGPRMQPDPLWMVGLEQERGIRVMGVDATDNLSDDPGYSPSECVVGAQLLIVGGELGFDPIEIGDFLGGFIMMDPRGDDR
jgi:hypothetical protein